MPDPRPEVFLGDLVRAMRRLGLDEQDEVDRAAVFLQLAVVRGPGPAVLETPSGGRGAAVGETVVAEASAAEPAGAGAAPALAAPEAVPSRMRITSTGDSPAPHAFLAGTLALGPPSEGRELPVPAPLFHPRWERALVSAAAASPERTGAVDVAKVVRRLARVEPVDVLPRRVRASLRLGAHVLIDVGNGMVPFVGDRHRLVETLRRVVGADRTPVLRFVGTPDTAGRGPRDRWARFEPTPGRPVILISDLGAAPSPDRASTARWVAFANRMREAGCRVVAFSPYPARRVPALAGRMLVVFWDGQTFPGSVARRARERW